MCAIYEQRVGTIPYNMLSDGYLFRLTRAETPCGGAKAFFPLYIFLFWVRLSLHIDHASGIPKTMMTYLTGNSHSSRAGVTKT